MVFLKLDPHCRHFPVASPLRPLKNKWNILNSLTVTVNFDTTLIFLLFHIVLTIILLITRSCALLHGLFENKHHLITWATGAAPRYVWQKWWRYLPATGYFCFSFSVPGICKYHQQLKRKFVCVWLSWVYFIYSDVTCMTASVSELSLKCDCLSLVFSEPAKRN